MDKKRSTGFWGFVLCLAACASCAAVTAPGSRPPVSRAARLRRPVAAAFLADGHTLCVANDRSGTVALVDVRGTGSCKEWAVGQRLTDLAVLPDLRQVLVVDEQQH